MKKIELFIAPVLAAILMAGCTGGPSGNFMLIAILCLCLGGLFSWYLGRKSVELDEIQKRAEAISALCRGGIITANEARSKVGLEPIQEFDRVVTQGHAWTITAPPQPETPTIELDPKRQIKVETD